VLSAVRWAAQLEQASPLEHSIEDGLGEVGIVRDPPQALNGLFVVKSIGR
jgi:hypothetical protein